MALLTAQNLAKSFGALDLFQGVSLSVPRKARIGLVGPNGSGKTTLLRILVGEESPSEGRVQRARGLRIGHLPQNADFQAQGTLYDLALQAFAELRRMEARLHELETALGKAPTDERLLARYGRLQAQFEQRGGYTYPARVHRVLHGLGFAAEEWHRPLAHLSGGQRIRAHLARLLLEEPDLLILDEPTNHLDLQAVEFLEGYLRAFPGALLFVSHDRYFLDQIAQTIWELSPHGMEVYRGNYTAYLSQREQRWQERRDRFVAEIARLHKDLDHIKRHIAGQNTAQAKGKLRRLSRAILALEKGGLRALEDVAWSRLSAELDLHADTFTVAEAEARLKALRFPDARPPRPKIRLGHGARSGDLVLRTYDLAVGYPDVPRPLFRVPDLTLRRGECAALIGPNGAGKTTFLKTVLGQVPPYAGQVQLGASLRIGYFAQAAADLNPRHTVLDELLTAAPHLTPAQARDHLARYLFRGDDIAKPVAVLSGGERGRLALAKLALRGANFLLLDEPTNHLDIPAQEALQTVLAEYPGTILLVSHDRYLIQALATQIWEILPDEAHLVVFAGTYEEYRTQRAELQTGEMQEQEPRGGTAPREAGPPQRSGPAPLSKNERRKLERRIVALEEEIGALEEELAQLEERLARPPEDPQEVRRLGETYATLQKKLEAHYAAWEDLHRRLGVS